MLLTVGLIVTALLIVAYVLAEPPRPTWLPVAVAITLLIAAILVVRGRKLWRSWFGSLNAINLISYITVLGLTTGTAAFVLVLSVFNGFEGLVVSLYSDFYPDLRIESAEGKTFIADSAKLNQLEQLSGVEAFSLVVEENALLAFGDQQHVAKMKGVQSNYAQVAGIEQHMFYPGEFVVEKNDQAYAIVGYGVDDALGIQGNVDDPFHPLSVYVPRKGRGASIMPGQDFRRKEMLVWGKFALQDEFDNEYVFMPLTFVQELLKYQPRQVSMIEINLKPATEKRTKRAIANLWQDDYRVLTQFEQNALLFKVMRVENLVVYLVFGFILLIVAFNMIGSLSMTVIDKKKDIAILRSMGATPQFVRRLFITEGVLQGIVSLGFGFGIAILLGLLQQHVGLVRLSGGGTFLLEFYPVVFKTSDFVLVGGIVALIAALAAWLPAARASRIGKIITN